MTLTVQSMNPNATDTPRVLFCSVFKPFTIDDEYNTPGDIIMHAVCHRAFTRRQGMFTIQQQSTTFPLHLIAYNLNAQSTVLEYPSIEEFTAEVAKGYDYIGITTAVSNLCKAERMCKIVKEISPKTKTVLGGGGTLAIDEFYRNFADYICRGEGIQFMRDLLGDTSAELRFPVVPSIQGTNTVLALPAHNANFVAAVGLGCLRGCEFCATSHQFGKKYIPIFKTGKELFGFMKHVEEYELQHGRRHETIGFMIYDENFLMNRELVDEFRLLNREQIANGTQFTCFVFSDASVISSYTTEQLLEMGVDSLWIGIESPTVGDLEKLKGVNVKALISELTSSGIKVFGSLIAGLEPHTEDLIRQDIEYALTINATAYQYVPVDPIPGTTYFSRLLKQGMIPDRDLKFFSMSHYNLKHPILDEETVINLTLEFYDRDYELNGPLVYRFLKGRWDGYFKHKDSANPAIKARTDLYKRDILRGFPVMLLGEIFGPSPHTRKLFKQLRLDVQRYFKRTTTLKELLNHQLTLSDGGIYLSSSIPGLRGLSKYALAVNVLLHEPRTSLREILFHPLHAIETARHGTITWDQPKTHIFTYPGKWLDYTKVL